jgi:hypothetical protein
LIEKLLASPQYVDHFTNTWRSLILPSSGDQRLNFLANSFEVWLRDKVRNDTGFDSVARDIIAAPLRPTGRGGAAIQQNTSLQAFFQANEFKPENLASTSTRVFLGIRLECAQCHDHPFAAWKRQQFWETAAFFANTRPVAVVPGKTRFQPPPANLRMLTIPGTNTTVTAKFPDGTIPRWENQSDPREAFADWMVSPKNPYFARTIANRVWAHFFGHGLIDPVDNEPTAENPISHPELLDELAQQFVAHRFDVKYLIRAITASKAYQMTSVQTHPSQKEARLFARMAVRGLTPEQLFDSLAQATGYRDPQAVPGRQIGFNPNSPRSEFLAKFATTDSVTERHTSILQALALMNGKFVGDATSLEKSKTLTAVAEAPFFDTPGRIEALYLATLSRTPRQEEMDRLTAYVNGGGPQHDPRAALADVFWALLNSSEFFLNH